MTGMTKSRTQLEASIARFQRGFWNKQTPDRPPMGIAPDRVWSPVQFLREPFPREYVAASDVSRTLVRSEYEDCIAGRAIRMDDWMPFSAAWRGIPWLEAICGCAVRYSTGSLAPERWADSIAELPFRSEWFECLETQTAQLAAAAPDDCWISPSILRGCSDVLAAVRGMSEFFLDLHDDPSALSAAAESINRLHLRVLKRHFEIVEPKLGGYGHIFGYWAPGPTTVLQEDVMGLCAPTCYRDHFLQYNAEITRVLGEYVLFHLHSIGYHHYRHVLDIPGIAGVEITVEQNGPTLAAMLPALREILDRSRLILYVDSHFDELRAAIRSLPKEGFYLVVSDKFVADDATFGQLVESLW